MTASTAVLPDAPDLWSYSSLKDVEVCPRRYVLSRATYADLWDRTGYPAVPNETALFGDVVHDSLETIVRALAARGCTSARGPDAVAALRELDGYTEVAEAMLAKRLARLEDNPRLVGDRRQRLQDRLEQRIPEIRVEIQQFVLSMTLIPQDGFRTRSGGQHFARGVGSHPEATLTADGLRFCGRIDLLNVGTDQVDITDYKTGAEDESHLDQLRSYAVLWDRDSISNPGRMPIGTLTASYPTRQVTIDAPDATQVQRLFDALTTRITCADDLVRADEPVASTGDHCRYCSVRPLFSAYWPTAPDPDDLKRGTWFDFEGIVVERNGIKSWWLHGSSPKKGACCCYGRHPLITHSSPGSASGCWDCDCDATKTPKTTHRSRCSRRLRSSSR